MSRREAVIDPRWPAAWRVLGEIARRIEVTKMNHDLTTRQLEILFAAAHSYIVVIETDHGRRCFLARENVTFTVKRLEALGLVRRGDLGHEFESRGRRIVCTPKGLSIVAEEKRRRAEERRAR